MEHIFETIQLCKEHGENNVDIRNAHDLIAAVQEGRFHLLIDPETEEIVGCISVYTYMAGKQQLNEIGTLILRPAYRELGIAHFLVMFTSLHSMLADPGSICVSELYHGSFKARAVLERLGFRQVSPCRWRVGHAASSTSRAVIHMELDEKSLPPMAAKLLNWVNGGAVTMNGVEVRVQFGSGYWLDTDPGRELLSRISAGDLSPLRGDEGEEASPPPEGIPPYPPGPTSGRRSGSR
jgi:hypothetical protein